MPTERIDWELDEEASDKERAILRWRTMTLRVGIGGDVAIYPKGVGLAEFPDLVQFYHSLEPVVDKVLGWFGPEYGGFLEWSNFSENNP